MSPQAMQISIRATGAEYSRRFLSKLHSCQGRNFGGWRCRIIDKKYTPEWSNVLCWRGILLSDSINPKKMLQQTSKDIGAENDLLNNLGFNLCVAPRSPVVRLVVYFGVVEVVKTEILRGQVKESE